MKFKMLDPTWPVMVLVLDLVAYKSHQVHIRAWPRSQEQSQGEGVAAWLFSGGGLVSYILPDSISITSELTRPTTRRERKQRPVSEPGALGHRRAWHSGWRGDPLEGLREAASGGHPARSGPEKWGWRPRSGGCARKVRRRASLQGRTRRERAERRG